MADLTSLDHGFRSGPLDYDRLTAQLRGWAEAYPSVVRLASLGTTPEGRELWHLTIGPDPDRIRPSVWIDGNMHACELAGSSVALAIAEDALRLHVDPDQPLFAMPPHMRERLREVLFYVLPRMSPDGAESVLKTGRYVRSIPRDGRTNKQHAYWSPGDIDGDGTALLMRLPDPTGGYIESSTHKGLMLPRTLEDEGPFYRLYPEGTIENFDGHHVPQPGYLSDTQTDLNRNFPYTWRHEADQAGAGAFPGSEPESRAVIEFADAHPEIFAWLNCHTFGGVFIRPLGDHPDSKMNEEDLAIYREIGHHAEQVTGYPMVSGFEEFLYSPDTPIYGDLSEYAYNSRGAIAYVVELWDLFKELGLPRPKKFVDYYVNLTRQDLERFFVWDRDKNGGRAHPPWRKAHHPQLGEVEVGGLDTRYGVWNPPPDRLPEICAAQSTVFLRLAAMAPALRVSRVRRDTQGDTTRLELAIENIGYLSTSILASATKLPHCEPLSWSMTAGAGVEVTWPKATSPRPIGHLAGWGRGRFGGDASLGYVESRGSGHRQVVEVVVRGHGVVDFEIGSCRVGWIRHREEV